MVKEKKEVKKTALESGGSILKSLGKVLLFAGIFGATALLTLGFLVIIGVVILIGLVMFLINPLLAILILALFLALGWLASKK